MSARSLLAAVAALPSLALVPAPAAAHTPPDDAFLRTLPAHAPPGVCYAHVKAGARWSPPGVPHARWRLEPGNPGPVWCLVTEPGAPPVMLEAERLGWIRVLCDADATPVRIRGLQHRLHERGMYDGAETGRYDDGTAAAVRRFQRERHIEGGGYLSLGTVSALEQGGGPFVGPQPGPPAAPGCCAPVIPPPPPPVVTIAVPAPTPPRSPWLTWAGKSVY